MNNILVDFYFKIVNTKNFNYDKFYLIFFMAIFHQNKVYL